MKICKYSRNNQKSFNSNKDFYWGKTPCLFYFRSVKFHHVKETRMMLVAFWRTLVKIVVVFQHKRQRNTDSDSPRAAIQSANELSLLVRVRLPFKNFCKVAKRAETTRNYQNRFWLWLIIFWQTHSLDTGVNSFLTELFSTEQTQKFTRITSRRADLIHSQHEIKEIIDLRKHTFSIKSEHKST